MFKIYYYALAFSAVVQAVNGIKKKQPVQNCEANTQYLINLLTLACDYVSDIDETTVRDACVGCFTSASRANNNQPSIDELAGCAAIYFSDNRFQECRNIIAASQASLVDGCVSGYCRFVRCVRRINSDILISRCYSEASVDNDAILEDEQITLFKNITSCVLARGRCLTINPITGQRQSNLRVQTSYDKFGRPVTTTVRTYNSLQINRAGDLRLIAFPGTTNIGRYLCSYEFNLAQSGWNNLNC